MCLIAFAYNHHPEYPLVLAANRDEHHQRPTRAARFWDNHHDILAGKDLEAGGTWMGISRTGRFSAVTNFRDPGISKAHPPSRGHLVLDYLKKTRPPGDYLSDVHQKADRYMGFNLLAGTPEKLYYYSNQQQEIRQLSSGIYGLSNHLLDKPWPKVNRSKERLEQLLKQPYFSEEALFELLYDDAQAPDSQLPDTGIPQEIEKKVSPVFIKGEDYGTRCSTLLLIDKNHQVTFRERRFKAGTQEITEENHYEFPLLPTP
ncbi:NRDE family protein [Fodinibius sediminis]|nr:NRDE family protein [Fodinibius sediminis]